MFTLLHPLATTHDSFPPACRHKTQASHYRDLRHQLCKSLQLDDCLELTDVDSVGQDTPEEHLLLTETSGTMEPRSKQPNNPMWCRSVAVAGLGQELHRQQCKPLPAASSIISHALRTTLQDLPRKKLSEMAATVSPHCPWGMRNCNIPKSASLSHPDKLKNQSGTRAYQDASIGAPKQKEMHAQLDPTLGDHLSNCSTSSKILPTQENAATMRTSIDKHRCTLPGAPSSIANSVKVLLENRNVDCMEKLGGFVCQKNAQLTAGVGDHLSDASTCEI